MEQLKKIIGFIKINFSQQNLTKIVEEINNKSYDSFLADTKILLVKHRDTIKNNLALFVMNKLYNLLVEHYVTFIDSNGEEKINDSVYRIIKYIFLLIYFNWTMFKQGLFFFEDEQTIISFLTKKRIGSYLFYVSLQNSELYCCMRTSQGIKTIPIDFRKVPDKDGKVKLLYEIINKYTFYSLDDLGTYVKNLWYEFNTENDIVCKRDNSYELGLYDEFREIGSGAYGMVYLARSKLDDKKVVFKFTTKNSTVEVEYEFLSMLQRERQHPNIIQMKNYIPCLRNPINDISSFGLVLEYASNGDLFSFIENTINSKIVFMNESIKYNVMRTLFLQMVEAVEYCHSKNIVHLDIKPENFLLDDKWTIKLSDFGLSQIQLPGTYLTEMRGTKIYHPPEIALSVPFDGKKVDAFALGICLFILLYNLPPYSESVLTDPYYRAIFQNDFETLYKLHTFDREKIIPELSSLFSSLLHPDPNKRMSVSDIKNQPWCRLEIYSPVSMESIINQSKQFGKKKRSTKRSMKRNTKKTK